MEEEFFIELKNRVLPYFEGTNPCHDFYHVDRVLSLAMTIGKRENADLDILRMAVLFHDVARAEQDESKGKVCHAKRGGEVAGEILRELGCSKEEVDRVVHCVETHRFRENSIPESIEAKVLYDADKLDGIGAIGILRATSFAGTIGAVVHNPDIEVDKTESYSKDDSAYREFLVKLVKIKDKMLTEGGLEVAKERQRFMNDFFDRANAEARGEL